MASEKRSLWDRVKEVGSREVLGGSPKKPQEPAPKAEPPDVEVPTREVEPTAVAPPEEPVAAAKVAPGVEPEIARESAEARRRGDGVPFGSSCLASEVRLPFRANLGAMRCTLPLVHPIKSESRL